VLVISWLGGRSNQNFRGFSFYVVVFNFLFDREMNDNRVDKKVVFLSL